MTRIGTLYGIGVGPGDPELITVKGLRILREVPVVATPKRAWAEAATPIALLRGISTPRIKSFSASSFP